MALWLHSARVAIAASYLTLLVADTSAAQDLAWPYALIVLCVFVRDLLMDWTEHHA